MAIRRLGPLKKDPLKVQAGRIGGLTNIARHGAHMSALGVAGNLRRFEQEVDPDGTLRPAEREMRAKSLRKAHMARLAMKSAAARRKEQKLPSGDAA
jgi:hypothetical protein